VNSAVRHDTRGTVAPLCGCGLPRLASIATNEKYHIYIPVILTMQTCFSFRAYVIWCLHACLVFITFLKRICKTITMQKMDLIRDFQSSESLSYRGAEYGQKRVCLVCHRLNWTACPISVFTWKETKNMHDTKVAFKTTLVSVLLWLHCRILCSFSWWMTSFWYNGQEYKVD